jgi:hypothetical protein
MKPACWCSVQIFALPIPGLHDFVSLQKAWQISSPIHKPAGEAFGTLMNFQGLSHQPTLHKIKYFLGFPDEYN